MQVLSLELNFAESEEGKEIGDNREELDSQVKIGFSKRRQKTQLRLADTFARRPVGAFLGEEVKGKKYINDLDWFRTRDDSDL